MKWSINILMLYRDGPKYCQPSRKLRIKYKIQNVMICIAVGVRPQTRQKRVHLPSVPLRLGYFATRSTAFTVTTLDYKLFTGTVDGHGCLDWAIKNLSHSCKRYCRFPAVQGVRRTHAQVGSGPSVKVIVSHSRSLYPSVLLLIKVSILSILETSLRATEVFL
jgi:hypothetical protein